MKVRIQHRYRNVLVEMDLAQALRPTVYADDTLDRIREAADKALDMQCKLLEVLVENRTLTLEQAKEIAGCYDTIEVL